MGDPKLADPIAVFCARRGKLAVDTDVSRTEDDHRDMSSLPPQYVAC